MTSRPTPLHGGPPSRCSTVPRGGGVVDSLRSPLPRPPSPVAWHCANVHACSRRFPPPPEEAKRSEGDGRFPRQGRVVGRTASAALRPLPLGLPEGKAKGVGRGLAVQEVDLRLARYLPLALRLLLLPLPHTHPMERCPAGVQRSTVFILLGVLDLNFSRCSTACERNTNSTPVMPNAWTFSIFSVIFH